MRFTKVSEATFKELQLEAGLVLNKFDPTGNQDVVDADIICATSGGIEVSCKPKYSNMAEDIDNVDENAIEFKRLDGWDCSMAFTSLSATAEYIRLALGAADIGTGGKVTPRMTIAPEKDAKDIWWVGDRADGGMVACCLKNSLSSEGLVLKSTKKGKGQLSCTLLGHVSIKAQNVVPMEFYVQEGTAAQEVK